MPPFAAAAGPPTPGAGGDLTQWLSNSGLQRLIGVFQQQEIETLEEAFALTDEELVEMGLGTADRSAFLGAVGSGAAGLPSQVDQWLESVGLGKHAGAFQQHGICTLEEVKSLNDADLKEMFVAIGPRKRIASAVQALRSEGCPAEDPGSVTSLATAMSEPPCYMPPVAQPQLPRQSPPPARYSPPSPAPARTPQPAPAVQQRTVARSGTPYAETAALHQQGGPHQWTELKHSGQGKGRGNGGCSPPQTRAGAMVSDQWEYDHSWAAKGKGKGGAGMAWAMVSDQWEDDHSWAAKGKGKGGAGMAGAMVFDQWGDDHSWGAWGKGKGFDGPDKSGGKNGAACLKSALKKTKICWDWQGGNCSHGNQCGFAHGYHELGQPRPGVHARFPPEPAIYESESSSAQEEQRPQPRRRVEQRKSGAADRADVTHVDPEPAPAAEQPVSASAVKVQQLEEQLRRLEQEKEKSAGTTVKLLEEELKRKEKEKQEEIQRAVQSALRTKTEDRERKHKMRIDDIASTYVATSDHKAVRRIMGKIGDMGNVVDIVFCMDGTGSMQPHIGAVRSNIVDISADLISACQLKSRVGIVVYRDYSDGDHRFETYDFMEPAEVQEALGRVRATGGADEAEDCIGGLEMVTQLNWQAPARVCIWIGDAPTHGSRFHDGAGDSHKGGDPDGRTPEKVLSIFNDKNIELIFLRIKPSTDKMVRVFSEVLAGFQRELQVYPMADKDGLRSVLTESITASVSRTASKSGSTRTTRKPFTMRPDFDWAPGHSCWGPKEKGTVYQLSAFEAKDIDAIIEVVVDGPHVSDKPAKICMTKDPAFKGELRLAYPCRMEGDWFWKGDQHLVAKESQYAASKYNSKKFHLDEASIQLVAAKLAQEWTKAVPDIPIEFLTVRVIALQDRPREHKYFQIEEYLPGKYLKWNNNNGYVSNVEEHPAMQAFSHWTYVRSKGLALVVDLQGVFTEETSWMGRTKPKYTLTDPAIHTGDPEKVMPSQTNLGRDGMARFFASHRCNDLCRHLKLPLPDGMRRATKEDVTRAAAASPDDAVSSWRPSMG